MRIRSSEIGKMVKLRQTAQPADKASWTEHFYSGELKVKNGRVETDNNVWVELLQQRGFSIVGDETEDATEEAREDRKEAAEAIESEAVTDEVPEQEIVPEGDASLEGKVSEEDAFATLLVDERDVLESEEAPKEDEEPKRQGRKAKNKENEHVNL